MPQQLIFDLPFRTAMGRADFFVSAANTVAVRGIDAWRDWPLAKMVLIGPQGAGKTHLAHVWAEETGAALRSACALGEADLPALAEAPALAIEGVDRIAGDRAAETRVFHLHNALAQRQAPLLLTGRAAPARWGITLPDLASRIAQAGLLCLQAPDDSLLGAVMVNLAQDRQLQLSPAVVSYTVRHVERSFAAIQNLVNVLDARALRTGKSPSTADVKAILAGGD